MGKDGLSVGVPSGTPAVQGGTKGASVGVQQLGVHGEDQVKLQAPPPASIRAGQSFP